MPDPHSISITAAAAALGATSLWLMLPRGTKPGRSVGVVLGVIALGLGMSQLPRLGAWMADGAFLILAGVTVISAVGAVTFRNPIYCAIWFGLSLLNVAGLFLFLGAEFLAVATVIVYAGAILVTFLFVLMLAQPEGRATYDRVSWEASLSAAAGMMIVGVLSVTIGGVFARVEAPAVPSVAPTAADRADNILAAEHVVRIGQELFGQHLIAVEVAGTLLLAAIVGAAVIVGERRGIRD